MEMASISNILPLVDDDGTEGTSIVWTIQNFSYCLHKPKEYLESPSFVLDPHEPERWRLILYPRGNPDDDNFSAKEDNFIALKLHVEDITRSRYVEFAFSIRTTRGSFKKIEDLSGVITRCETLGHRSFLKREELGKKGTDYLNNDAITLRCRIWKVGDKLLPPTQYCMRTMISVEKETRIWSLEKFKITNDSSNEIANPPISLELQSLIAIKLLSYRDSFSGDRIKLEIKHIDKDKPCVFSCGLSLLEADGKVIYSRQEHRFDPSDDFDVWAFPCVPLNKIRDYENTYLRCELVVSSGEEHSWVESVESSKIDSPTLFKLKKEQDFANSWTDDFNSFFSEGAFKDVTLRTPNEDIPAYKSALCARSDVFHAMFAQDMAESQSGIVNIDDIDADIVHKMLLFVYSDVVEDLDFDVASKLYIAADKYRINALRRRCLDFFKDNLSVSNVCEVFMLGDRHSDKDLKSFVLDFIMEHAAEVMNSDEWKRFMEDYPHLASETLLLREFRI